MQVSNNRVLFVSEDKSTREQLTLQLTRRGYRVMTAESLVTAHIVSCGQVFNLYVIDAQFWGSQGVALCGSIRKFDPLSPIILYSSDAAESTRQRAFDAGATFYILKPDLGKLIEAVGHVTHALSPTDNESGRIVWTRHAKP